MSEQLDSVDKLMERWKQHPPLFMRQVLGYPLKRFQEGMVTHKGAVKLGRNISLRLLPRDSGKSWGGTIGTSVYKIVHEPDTAIQIIAEAYNTAVMFLREVKAHFEGNAILKEFYGNHVSKDTAWSSNRIISAQRTKIRKEPTVEVFGAGTAIVGRHVPTQILDDVATEKTSDTEEKRAKLLSWYDKVCMPVLEQGGEQIINGTRYFENDLYQTLVERFGPSILFRVPALMYVDPVDYVKPRMGDYMKNPQSLISRSYFPQRYTADVLEEIKRLNMYTFTSQYQNEIRIQASGLLNVDAIHIIKSSDLPPMEKLIGVVGVDPCGGQDAATKRKGSTDFFAATTVGYDRNTGNVYVLRSHKRRLSDPKDMLDLMLGEWRWCKSIDLDLMSFLVESNIFQAVLARAFRAETSKYGVCPVEGVKQTSDKMKRFISLVGVFNSGRVYFVDDCIDLLENLIKFPNLQHDDDVDSLMTALEGLTDIGLEAVAIPLGMNDLITAVNLTF